MMNKLKIALLLTIVLVFAVSCASPTQTPSPTAVAATSTSVPVPTATPQADRDVLLTKLNSNVFEIHFGYFDEGQDSNGKTFYIFLAQHFAKVKKSEFCYVDVSPKNSLSIEDIKLIHDAATETLGDEYIVSYVHVSPSGCSYFSDTNPASAIGVYVVKQ